MHVRATMFFPMSLMESLRGYSQSVPDQPSEHVVRVGNVIYLEDHREAYRQQMAEKYRLPEDSPVLAEIDSHLSRIADTYGYDPETQAAKFLLQDFDQRLRLFAQNTGSSLAEALVEVQL
jgi:hypothetical protein